MKTQIVTALLMVTACSADVELALDVGARDGAPDGSPWSVAESDLGIRRLAWATDGDLLVSAAAAGPVLPGDPFPIMTGTAILRRYSPSGDERWSSAIDWTWPGIPHFTAFASLADGTTIAAVSRGMACDVDGPCAVTPASLHWYDAAGALVGTRELSAASGRDAIVVVSDILPMDDGGIVLTGVTGRPDGPAFVGRFAPSGALEWTVPIAWRLDGGQGRWIEIPHFGSNAIRGLTRTADQGLLFFGRYFGDITVGDRRVRDESRFSGAVYVARVELDGTVSWLQTIRDNPFDEDFGWTSGMAVTESGRVLLTGALIQFATAGDFRLEEPFEFSHPHYRVELDLAGSVRDLILLRPSDQVVERGDTLVGSVMAARGEDVLLAGTTLRHRFAPFLIQVGQNYVASYDRDGDVADEIQTSTPELADVSLGWVSAIAVSSGGRVALGGTFNGGADFGQGPLVTEPTGDPIYPYEESGYIAVYAASSGVD